MPDRRFLIVYWAIQLALLAAMVAFALR